MESILNNKLGIIGSSLIAEEHILAFQENDFDVTCIASSNNSKTAHTLAKKYKSVKYFPSVPEMLQEGEYSSLAILSSVESLYSNLIKALDYADYIFIEKPVALQLDHVEKILSDNKVMVGMVERFNPAIQTLKSVINIDNIINIDFSRCCVSTQSSRVSIFEDIGIHDIDLLFYLLNLESVSDYSVISVDQTTIFTSSEPLSRMIWSKDTFFKERKIIVRQKDCTYEVDLQEQSVVKHSEINKNHVSQSLFVEKASPVENEQRAFFNHEVVDCKKSHELLFCLMEQI